MTTATEAPSRRILSRSNIHRATRYILGVGSILFGLMATSDTERMAQVMETDEAEVRRLAMRDLSSGISLLTGSRKLRPLLSRLRYDIGNIFTFSRKQPVLAPVAIAFAVLGLVAIFTRE